MATNTRIAPCLRAVALALALASGLPSALAAPVAPPLLLAEELRGDVALADYWVSEKLDGAREGRGQREGAQGRRKTRVCRHGQNHRQPCLLKKRAAPLTKRRM